MRRSEFPKKWRCFIYKFSIRLREKSSLTPRYPMYIKMQQITSILCRNSHLSPQRIRETTYHRREGPNIVILGPKWPILAQNWPWTELIRCFVAMATHHNMWNSHVFDAYPIAWYNTLIFCIVTDTWSFKKYNFYQILFVSGILSLNGSDGQHWKCLALGQYFVKITGFQSQTYTNMLIWDLYIKVSGACYIDN